MKIALEDARARWLFLAAVFLIAVSFTYEVGKVWLAAQWGASSDPDRLLRAASLEPTNADYWDRVGFYEKWDLEHGDLRRAVVYYQRATEANPQSDRYWMDLADAYEASGQTARAREAFNKAQSFHPISSDVAWRYGNFLLRQGNDSEAFAEIRRALLTDPNLTTQAVSECSKARNDLAGILAEILPPKNQYYLAALQYFVSQHQIDAALSVWDQLLRLKQPFQITQILLLVNELIGEQDVEGGLRVWRQALAATGWQQDEDRSSSLVFNGGFEHDVLNGGFDWREVPVSGAAFSVDTSATHGGARALRIVFDGSTNVDFQNLWQFSPVEPNQHYHFTAYLRTEQISTDSGVRFAIYDAFHPAATQILTSDLVGTHPWSLVEKDLVTGPETHSLVISLRRVSTWKFDNKLSGTVWVDDVSLVPASGDTKERSR